MKNLKILVIEEEVEFFKQTTKKHHGSIKIVPAKTPGTVALHIQISWRDWKEFLKEIYQEIYK